MYWPFAVNIRSYGEVEVAIKVRESVPESITFFRRNLEEQTPLLLTNHHPTPGESLENIPIVSLGDQSESDSRILESALYKLGIHPDLPE